MTVEPPVSVKAALRCGDRWVLLRNGRGEWELPGGRIDPVDASLQATLRRECREELGVEVEIGRLVDSWLFEVVPNLTVVIICYAATGPDDAQLSTSDEHDAAGFFTIGELDQLVLPEGYRNAIERAANLGSPR